MSKTVKVIVLTTAICAVMFGTVLGCGLEREEYVKETGTEKPLKINGKHYRQKKEKLNYTGKMIQVDLKQIDFSVCTSDDENFYLEYDICSKKDKNPLSVSVKDETLVLKEQDGETAEYYEGVYVDGIGNLIKGTKERYRGVAVLYVPVAMNEGSLSLNMGNGDAEIQGTVWKELNVKMENGDLQLADGSICNGSLLLTEGDIETENVGVSGRMEVQTGEGDIDWKLNPSDYDNLPIYARTEMDIDVLGVFDGNLIQNESNSFYKRIVENEQRILKLISEEGDVVIESYTQ